MHTESKASLPAPSLPQLNAHGTLSLGSIGGGVEVTVPAYPSMRKGDLVTVRWEGKPANPEITFPVIHTIDDPIEPKTYWIDYLSVYREWKTLKLWYHVNGVGDSEAVEVDIVE